MVNYASSVMSCLRKLTKDASSYTEAAAYPVAEEGNEA